MVLHDTEECRRQLVRTLMEVRKYLGAAVDLNQAKSRKIKLNLVEFMYDDFIVYHPPLCCCYANKQWGWTEYLNHRSHG